jgi:hypothetical protein
MGTHLRMRILIGERLFLGVALGMSGRDFLRALGSACRSDAELILWGADFLYHDPSFGVPPPSM